MGWLPQIFRDAGLPASTAGALLAVTMGLGVPLSFLLPRIAAGMRHQSALAAVLGLSGLLGYAGLYFAPAAGAWAWALLLGISNCAFPLVLTLIGMRSRTTAGVIRLSAFAQSTGYLLSVPGPLLIGVLYQHSGGWGLPLALMSGLMVVQLGLGVRAAGSATSRTRAGARSPPAPPPAHPRAEPLEGGGGDGDGRLDACQSSTRIPRTARRSCSACSARCSPSASSSP